ncbi:hypothetical protein [Pseudomonas sp. NBRC 111130]|uniref:hypothetical protein n=1 Tax=Pseudomonas sp. NBRC 111130 TaxID=1661045 RepID=UPI000AB53FC6|nr:hypothetical protein [Pseudomonas sp. NBRC 111130]
MPTGLRVDLESGGTFQIDSEVRVSTLAFQTTYSGPFTANSGPFVSVGYYFDLTVPSNITSLFFSSSTSMFIALWAKSGTTWRFKVSAQGTINIYGFADQQIAPSNVGFQTFSSSGMLTFDAAAKWMRIADIVRGAASGTVKNYPADGRSYAAGIGSYPKRGAGAAQAGVPYWVQFSYGLNIGPNSYGVGELPISSRPTGGGGVPPPPSSPAMQPPTLMLVDVSYF